MANYQHDLNRIFHALADPTRRQVLERLNDGSATVKELAEPFDMALPSFMKHLRVLEQTALVRSQKTGRVRTYWIQPTEMRKASNWLNDQLNMWETRLDQLDEYALTLTKKQEIQSEEEIQNDE